LTTSDQKIKLTNNTKHTINMKKLLTILAIASATTFAYAQGTVILQNGSALFFVSTNAAALTPPGGIGVTAKTALGFDYAVLTATFGGPVPSSSPLDGAWTGAILTGVNFALTAGGVSGQGSTAGATAAGWAASATPNYSDGTEKYFMIVGWSSNLGTTWATVAANLASNWATPWLGGNAFFGTSTIGSGFSGGGPFSLPAPSLWGTSVAMPGGLSSGFQLMAVIVPEPTTMALFGLGGLSLLLFRRRK
jgi:hypothetical protein